MNWIGHNLTCFWKWFIDGKTLTQFIKDSAIVIITKRVLLISSQKEKKWQISVRFSKLLKDNPFIEMVTEIDCSYQWGTISLQLNATGAIAGWRTTYVTFLKYINLFGDNFNMQSVPNYETFAQLVLPWHT